MDYLKDWISQIVIFIFIATIISALIPSNSHSKVIKFVFGLMIFLLFLNPLVRLFQIEPETISSEWNYTSDQFQEEKIEDQLEQKKVEIQATGHAYILEQIEHQMLTLVEEELNDQYDITIHGVSLVVEEEKESEEWILEDLQSITFYLEEESSEEVEEVAPIDLRKPYENPSNREKELKSRITDLLDVPQEIITFVWEGE
ncbi:stage III sporulation protein AF [Halalkalibacillus sediminis]|uniref:stage III sporulation protein AF n=1 Tax=Halalkalibacillus sediminis TaxID=2018042 RepID=UPI0013901588|nr:stage III sporulation protein AF [Halalkalibacillus sediminis]